LGCRDKAEQEKTRRLKCSRGAGGESPVEKGAADVLKTKEAEGEGGKKEIQFGEKSGHQTESSFAH